MIKDTERKKQGVSETVQSFGVLLYLPAQYISTSFWSNEIWEVKWERDCNQKHTQSERTKSKKLDVDSHFFLGFLCITYIAEECAWTQTRMQTLITHVNATLTPLLNAGLLTTGHWMTLNVFAFIKRGELRGDMSFPPELNRTKEMIELRQKSKRYVTDINMWQFNISLERHALRW